VFFTHTAEALSSQGLHHRPSARRAYHARGIASLRYAGAVPCLPSSKIATPSPSRCAGTRRRRCGLHPHGAAPPATGHTRQRSSERGCRRRRTADCRPRRPLPSPRSGACRGLMAIGLPLPSPPSSALGARPRWGSMTAPASPKTPRRTPAAGAAPAAGADRPCDGGG
jgi:hypothetical protein